jgi:low temperature requirement protein LtrA
MASSRWILPSLHSGHEGGHERKVTWLELFYDLVYVAAIIQLGNMLSDDVSWGGLLRFVALFIPIWWSWTGATFYVNRFAVDDVVHRVLIFIQIGFIAILAMSTQDAFGALGQQFTLAYVGIRLVLVALYVRAYRHMPEARPLTRRYAIGFTLAAMIWLASAFVPPPARYALWILGMAADFAVPLTSRRLNALLPPDVPHMAERYGLFTIIVMGEAFVKVISSAPAAPLAVQQLLLGGLGLVIAGSIWWLYFDDVAGSPVKATSRAAYVWIYSHLPLAIGLTAFGVGIKKVIFLNAGEALPEKYRLLVGGALVVYLIFGMLIDLVTTRSPGPATFAPRRRTALHFGAAAAVAALALVTEGLPTLLWLGLVAAVCAATVVIDVVATGKDEEELHGPALD